MKKRMIRVALVYCGIGLASLLCLFLFRIAGRGIPCLFHELTGLLCPGCGLTRAVSALSRGQIKTALSYNPMLPLYAAYGAWFGGTVTVKYIRKENDPLFFGPAWIHAIVLAAIVLFGILRNIF